jgi:hypothetical protein
MDCQARASYDLRIKSTPRSSSLRSNETNVGDAHAAGLILDLRVMREFRGWLRHPRAVRPRVHLCVSVCVSTCMRAIVCVWRHACTPASLGSAHVRVLAGVCAHVWKRVRAFVRHEPRITFTFEPTE